MKYDFKGWATVNNIKCADGRTILRDAFKDDDGLIVPLVWNHQHDDPDNILGHALLQNADEGVIAYGYFNDTESGKTAKEIVEHGDIKWLSIYANKLKQKGSDVVHGAIREVSLVIAGANPGARIDSSSIAFAHGEDGEVEEAIIYTGMPLEFFHSEDKSEEKEDEKEDKEVEKDEKMESSNKTLKEIYETLNDEQKQMMAAVVGMALNDSKGEDDNSDDEPEEGEKTMKHNVFEAEDSHTTLTHADAVNIFEAAKKKRVGLKEAYYDYVNDTLAHSIDTTGMDTATGNQTYGFNDPDMLFPEYKTFQNEPEFISREMDWATEFLNEAHHSPFSRIKSVFADITEDEARARGYVKAHQKVEEVFTLLKRQTSPQTIYKKQKMDRDDITDITDFDVVRWIKGEMRMMLNEEIARAAMIGDGRSGMSNDKIFETNIRPISTDVPLFNIKVKSKDDPDKSIKAENFIKACIRARNKFKGTGRPNLYTTSEMLTEMLLIENGFGQIKYENEEALCKRLRVAKIVTVEVFEGHKISGEDLLGIIVNPRDYNFGADKGGAVSLFDDFDIDYNQYKYLIETRCSGALTKPFSAITVTLEPISADTEDDEDNGEDNG